MAVPGVQCMGLGWSDAGAMRAKTGVEPTSSMRAIAAMKPIDTVRVVEHDGARAARCSQGGVKTGWFVRAITRMEPTSCMRA